MREHGGLGVTGGSRGVAKHVNIIRFRLELVQINVFVFPSMLNDFVDVHNCHSSIRTILLDRIVIVVHTNQELDAICLSLRLQEDELTKLTAGTGYGGQLCLPDDEFDGGWSERVIKCDRRSAQGRTCQISQNPLRPILAIDSHEVPRLALSRDVLHHV